MKESRSLAWLHRILNDTFLKVGKKMIAHVQFGAVDISLYRRLRAIHSFCNLPVAQPLISAQNDSYLLSFGQTADGPPNNQSRFLLNEPEIRAGRRVGQKNFQMVRTSTLAAVA